jgi:hypothetical protein
MISVCKMLFNRYLDGLLEVLAGDDVFSIPRENAQVFLLIMSVQRASLYFKSWGIFNHPYKVL